MAFDTTVRQWHGRRQFPAILRLVDNQYDFSGMSRRHSVRPVVTGWPRVHGSRGETNAIEKMRKAVEDNFYCASLYHRVVVHFRC